MITWIIALYNSIKLGAMPCKATKKTDGSWKRVFTKQGPLEKRMANHFRIFALRTPSDKIRSVTQLCPTLCDPMNHSTPGLPVHHQLPEFTMTHILRVSDAIQPSHPLSSPSPPAPNPSQHQSLFQ